MVDLKELINCVNPERKDVSVQLNLKRDQGLSCSRPGDIV